MTGPRRQVSVYKHNVEQLHLRPRLSLVVASLGANTEATRVISQGRTTLTGEGYSWAFLSVLLHLSSFFPFGLLSQENTLTFIVGVSVLVTALKQCFSVERVCRVQRNTPAA